MTSKTDTGLVRVTLRVPKYLIPEGTKDPSKALAALIVASLWEYRISVVYISKPDAQNLIRKKESSSKEKDSACKI